MPKKQILLVEDVEAEAMLMRIALRKSGTPNDVILAEDGVEALELLLPDHFPSSREIIDLPSLVLLDLNLPRVSGFEVLKHVRSHEVTRTLPVVVLSSSVCEEDVRNCYLLGANSYIRKQVVFDDFVDSVDRLTFYWLCLNEAALPMTHPYPQDSKLTAQSKGGM
jgi:two-component system, response regulator